MKILSVLIFTFLSINTYANSSFKESSISKIVLHDAGSILISLKNGQEVSWVGLDENGLAIVKSNGKELFLSPVDISEQFGDIDLT